MLVLDALPWASTSLMLQTAELSTVLTGLNTEPADTGEDEAAPVSSAHDEVCSRPAVLLKLSPIGLEATSNDELYDAFLTSFSAAESHGPANSCRYRCAHAEAADRLHRSGVRRAPGSTEASRATARLGSARGGLPLDCLDTTRAAIQRV
mgnify:CR=1 FL=1